MSDHEFDNPAALDAALADWVTARLEHAVTLRNEAYLIVSGGSTPQGFFAELATRSLPWERITVIPADERWVPLTHDDCNEAMIRRHLMRGPAAAANLVSLLPGYPDREVNTTLLTERLRQAPVFDVVLLGMGLDGHTASLFPCSGQLTEGLKTTAPVLMTEPTTAPHARVSLSRQRLANTHHGLIHIVGAGKRNVLEAARREQNPQRAPIAAFLGETPFSLWYAP